MSVATFKVDPAIERIWRENRCLKSGSIQVYRYNIYRFLNYCQSRKLAENAQLTRAGVTAFSRSYARSHRRDFKAVFDAAHGALSTWATARRTLGEELPPWVPATNPLTSLSPVLREFAEYLRDHRGNPAVRTPATRHRTNAPTRTDFVLGVKSGQGPKIPKRFAVSCERCADVTDTNSR